MSVISTDNTGNCTGERKRHRILAVAPQGFCYIGDSRADLPSWRSAKAAVVVSSSPRLARRVERDGTPVVARVPKTGPAKLLLRCVRPHHWSKNGLVLVPLMLAHRFFHLASWKAVGAMFVAFCACASAAYVLNDIADLAGDRLHSTKKHRPFASGELNPLWALVIVPCLLGLAVICSLHVPSMAALALGAYCVITMLYTAWLKTRLLIDVFVLAGLYTLRLYAGGAACHVAISPWTLAFSMFLLLSLALVKRVAELRAMLPEQNMNRRGYQREDISVLESTGMASGYLAVVVLAMYINSPEVLGSYHRPTPPLVFVPIDRILDHSYLGAGKEREGYRGCDRVCRTRSGELCGAVRRGHSLCGFVVIGWVYRKS